MYEKDALNVELPVTGPRAGASSGEPVESLLEIWNNGTIEFGIWECTPGTFPGKKEGIHEVVHFIAGDATITDEDGEHHIGPGVVMAFPDGWSGTWEIRETVRKVFTVVKSA